MDHLEAPGWVARDRGVEHGYGSVVLRPKEATVTFVTPAGDTEVMDYDQLIAEGERLRAQAQGAAEAQPRRGQHYSFDFDSPTPGGRR